MNQTISVIVPVYNVAAYLPQCIESLLGQTYSDLEILLVDDGSTDDSGKICDRYASMDSRIHVIHQKNGGAANAKNSGLRAATGMYLAFADSDDYVEKDAYAFMLSQMREHHADIIQCAHNNVFTNCIQTSNKIIKDQELTAEEFLKLYTTDWTCGLLWDKLYDRRLFKDIFFVEGHKIDDEYFTYRGVMNADKIVRSPRVVYNYRMRKSSVMSSESSMEQIVLDRLDFMDIRRKNVVSKFPKLKKDFDNHYANMLLLLIHDSYATQGSIVLTQKMMGDFLNEKPSPDVGFRLKIQIFQLQHRSVSSILFKRLPRKTSISMEQYFN